MSVDKKISYEVQGGAKNYLGKQKQVTAPIKWKSSPDSPETELAYITKAEKDLLVKKDIHGSLKGDVNRGPSGIMSLDGYGSFDGPDPSKDTGMSGAATSDAEAGRTTANTRAEGPGSANLPPGVRDKGLDDYRNAFIAAGGGQRVNPRFFDSRNVVSPAELARAKAFNPTAFRKGRGQGLFSFLGSGGILGNLIRGIGQKFGLGKRFNEPTYDMSRFNKLGLGGIDPFANLDIRDKFDRRNIEVVEDTDADAEVQEKYNNYLLDAPPNPLTLEQFKNALEGIKEGTLPNTSTSMLPTKNLVADALTIPTFDDSGVSLRKRMTLYNAGYNDRQIKEALDAGYLDQLVRDIEGPPIA